MPAAPPHDTPEARAEIARASRQRIADLARRRSPGKRFRYWLDAVFLYALGGILRLLPVDMASAFGGWIGRRVLAPLIPMRSACHTVRVPFPTLTDAEIAELLAGMFENLGRVLAEFVHLDAFSGKRGDSRITYIGIENITEAWKAQKGVIAVGGHFANWELLPVVARNVGYDGSIVIQHPSNPYIVEWLARQRYRYGVSDHIAHGEKVYRRVRDTIARGSWVGILADQGVRKGVAAPFFGIEVQTNVMPARLALEFGCPIILIGTRRLKGAHFEMSFSEPRQFFPTGDRAADERAIMTWVNQFYERQLLQAPEQWLWGSPRWGYGGEAAKPAPGPDDDDESRGD